VELSDVVSSAVEATRPFIDEASHELIVTLPDQPIFLNADPHRLAQVFSNLLNNAAKYTPEGGRISLTAERKGCNVVLSVEDNGIGIPAKLQADIFNMFTQIERPAKQIQQGLGVGLTLVKSLVEMHTGTVAVQSEGENQGSVFGVTLPLLAEQPRPTLASAPESENTGGRISRRVLVVDDNRAAADMLRLVMKMLGNEVWTANDGQEAIEVAAEFLPEVILMDLGMPKVNGYEAARHIREQAWGKDILLVALTGWGQEDDRQRTLEAGFDHHLVKPAEPAAIQELLKNLHTGTNK